MFSRQQIVQPSFSISSIFCFFVPVVSQSFFYVLTLIFSYYTCSILECHTEQYNIVK